MKKLIILLTLFAAFHSKAIGQEQSVRKYRFGMSLNPQYSYRIYYAKKDFQFAKKLYDSTETGKITYAVGSFAERSLSEKLTFRVGLNFMSGGFRTKKKTFTWGSDNNNGQIQIDPDPTIPREGYFVYNHQYFEIPIDFQYFLSKNQHFYFNLGVAPNFNIHNSVTSHWFFIDGRKDVKKMEDKQTQYQKVGFTFQLGMGYNIKISEKITLDIQPRFQYFATPLYKINIGGRANTFLYNAGLQIGVKI